jgi:hypothetical protein
LIVFRELLNINKPYIKNMDGLLNTSKSVHKMSVGAVKTVVAVHNCILRCGGFMIIDFYNNSYHEEIPDILLI